MKNQFAKYAKYLTKSDRLVIQHDGDDYYLCDGITALKIPEALYRAYFRPISGVFIELNNGERAAKMNGDAMPVKRDCSNIKNIIDITSAENPAK